MADFLFKSTELFNNYFVIYVMKCLRNDLRMSDHNKYIILYIIVFSSKNENSNLLVNSNKKICIISKIKNN